MPYGSNGSSIADYGFQQDFAKYQALQNNATPGTAGTPGTPAPTSPGSIPTVVTGNPQLPDYSQISNIIQQINATNQQAQQSANTARIPGAAGLEAQSSQDIAALLNPPTSYSELDVPAASRAVASGTSGSPFAFSAGTNMTRTQRNADIAAGQQQLSAAYARNPGAPIANPQAMVELLQQQQFQAQQQQLQRDLQERIANATMANAALQNRLYGRFHPNYSTGGGTSRLPGQSRGRTAADGTTYQTDIPVDVEDQYDWSDPAAGVPNYGGVENWDAFGPDQQAAYNQALGQNPYYGRPDWQNPYSGDEAPLPDLGPAEQMGYYDPSMDYGYAA